MDAALQQPIVRTGWVWEHYNANASVLQSCNSRSDPACSLDNWSCDHLIIPTPHTVWQTVKWNEDINKNLLPFLLRIEPTTDTFEIWHDLWRVSLSSRSLVMVHLTLLAPGHSAAVTKRWRLSNTDQSKTANCLFRKSVFVPGITYTWDGTSSLTDLSVFLAHSLPPPAQLQGCWDWSSQKA